ncbi:KAP family P-loop NTPase fold protein [Cohnella terricola]|uniref:KAP NTPase domain-containing protein n=1 Tax=Cohnella terricola TaxID=1289167 RepID=A0A559JBX7_9BACL|nr:P-loop NTPase fold protein [Cohnella terricola]TVX97380.1 hypothetical protein FPZ45_18790 [Cohnella terricola]
MSWRKHKKRIRLKEWIVFLILAIFSYSFVLILRITAEPILQSNPDNFGKQLAVLFFVCISIFVWILRYKQAPASGLLKPLHKIAFPAVTLGIVIDYVVNDQNKLAAGGFWSLLYDATVFLCVCLLIPPQSRRTKDSNKDTASNDHFPSEIDMFYSKPSLGIDGVDELNRNGFAAHLASILNDRMKQPSSNSLTIGLYGPWGSGKSSVFDLMESSHLDADKIIRFHPWYLGKDLNNIVPEFMKLLIQKVQGKNRDNKELLKQLSDYTKYLMPVSIRPPGLIYNFKDFMSEPEYSKDYADASKLKKRIVDLLENNPFPLIVFIDDLDRLDNKEIQMVFKLVRMIADFPNIVYVIAMDEEIVAKSLSQLYSKDFDIKTGLKYIEKFIQVPIYLPRVDPELLLGLLVSRMKSILRSNDIVVSDTYFMELMTQFNFTPRNVERLLNLLQVHLPLLKEEVYPEDLIALMAIKIDNPELFVFIYENSNLFLGMLNKKGLEDKKGFANGILERNFQAYIPWLESLFPKLGESKVDDGLMSGNKRICSPEHFQTYFMYSVPLSKISQKMLNAFYNILIEDDLELIRETYMEMTVSSNLSEVNTKLGWYSVYHKNIESNIRLLKFLFDFFDPMQGTHQSVGDLRETLMRSLIADDRRVDLVKLIGEQENHQLFYAAEAYRISDSGSKCKSELLDIVNSRFDFFILGKYGPKDASMIFNVWLNVDEHNHPGQVRKTVAEWVRKHDVWQIFDYFYSEIDFKNAESLHIFVFYSKILKFIPADAIERDVNAFGKIESKNELKKLLSSDVQAMKACLSFGHTMSYDYAAERLYDMESDSDADWNPKLISAIEWLCTYGDQTKTVELKERWSRYKESRNKELSIVNE